MENVEKIMDKIRKLLALSNNNPNEHEAMAAALKAQKLMAEYDIEVEQLEDKPANREIAEETYWSSDKHEMKKWKVGLSSIIAKNFRCRVYLINGKDVVFYGYKEDAKIARQVFSFLYETGNKLAIRYYNKCKKEGLETRGLMNTYLSGFRKGVADILDKQCVALMIIIPQEVEDSFAEISKNFKHLTTRLNLNGNSSAYEDGRTDGRNTANARSLTA